MLCALPAFAQPELPPQQQFTEEDVASEFASPAFQAQVRNLVKILFPESSYTDQKKLLLAKFDTMLDERFGCVKEGSEVQKNVHAKLEELYSYDAMVEQITPLFGELSEQDIMRVMEFYRSGTGEKWARISAGIPEEARKAGAQIGTDFGKEIMPILMKDKTCADNAMKKSGEKGGQQ